MQNSNVKLPQFVSSANLKTATANYFNFHWNSTLLLSVEVCLRSLLNASHQSRFISQKDSIITDRTKDDNKVNLFVYIKCPQMTAVIGLMIAENVTT